MTGRPDLYETDFYAWTQSQAKELRRFARLRPNVPLDLRHLAQEIADLGKRDHRDLRSFVLLIIEHLLKLAASTSPRPRYGWEREILNYRRQAAEAMTATLRRKVLRDLDDLYTLAKRQADRDLRQFGEDEAADRLPQTCPYTLEQVLEDWWPEPPPAPSPDQRPIA